MAKGKKGKKRASPIDAPHAAARAVVEAMGDSYAPVERGRPEPTWKVHTKTNHEAKFLGFRCTAYLSVAGWTARAKHSKHISIDLTILGLGDMEEARRYAADLARFGAAILKKYPKKNRKPTLS